MPRKRATEFPFFSLSATCKVDSPHLELEESINFRRFPPLFRFSFLLASPYSFHPASEFPSGDGKPEFERKEATPFERKTRRKEGVSPVIFFSQKGGCKP